MAVKSIIKLSDLEGAKRIDAEYYQPEYLKIKGLPNSSSIGSLANDIRYGLYVEPNYKEYGVNFIRALNLLDFCITGEILKIEENKVSMDYRLKKGDCLIVRSGANTGSVSYIYSRFENATFGSYTIRIRFNETRINPAYGTLFLITRHGTLQTRRFKSGSAQFNLNIPNIKEIKIPLITFHKQEEIEAFVQQIEKWQEQSRNFYSQAETLLLEELGLKDFKPKYKISYVSNLSEAFDKQRVDAEYFQPAYKELIKYLAKNFELRPIKDFLLSFQKGIEVGSQSYCEEGKPFIRVSNISINGFTDKDQQFISQELYQNLKNTYEPKVGDFLLTKDATPGIAYVVKEPVEGIIASGILNLKIDKEQIEKEYLALCINSIIGKLQIERDGGGSVITHWRPEQIKKLLIPILPQKTQAKIASLVQQSHQARKKAKELLEEAKRKVEEAIEKAT